MPPLAFLEVYMIRVMVNGAGGKMGREVVKAVHNDPAVPGPPIPHLPTHPVT